MALRSNAAKSQLDRAGFKTLVGEVARDLAERRAEVLEDYVEGMSPIGYVAPKPAEAIPTQLA